MSQPAAPAPDAPAKKKSKLPLILAAVVVLLGGGGGAYWYFVMRPAQAAAQAAGKGEHGEDADHGEDESEGEEAEEKPEHGIVPFEAFVVNLADPGGRHFLRVSLSLVLKDEEHAKELEEAKVEVARIRSGILELLTQQAADHVVTPEGKAELKDAIADQVKEIAHTKVIDVLFSEFVVQF